MARPAKLTGDAETLANALERMDGYADDLPMAIAPAQAQGWTVGPLARRSLLTRAFSTYAPVGERADACALPRLAWGARRQH